MNQDRSLLEKSSQKDLNPSDEIPFIHKIYAFFYNVLLKKSMNQYIYCLLFLLEAVQLNSYVFERKHAATWALPSSSTDLLYLIIGSLRVSPLMQYLSFTYFIILWAIILVFIFIHSLTLLMSIQFNKTSSRYYAISAQYIRVFTDILLTFLCIPFIEILLMMLNCNGEGNTIGIVTNGIVCFQGIHWLYVILSIVFIVLLMIVLVFSLMYSFDPFNQKRKTVRVEMTSDQFLLVFKLIASIQSLLINEEWVCILLMLVIAIFNLKISIDSPSYGMSIQQRFIQIRNASFLWAYFILFIAKALNSSTFNGQIYLLVFGYPLVIAVILLHYHQRYNEAFGANQSAIVVSDFIHKAIGVISLIDDFLMMKSLKGIRNPKENRNEILLRGYIINHLETCLLEECALGKFIENMGNFNIQKTCLLQHMNFLFVEGIKKFPESRLIVLFYISFNFDKKYNLNVAKTFLAKLEKGENTILENYMIYSIKQTNNIRNNGDKRNDKDEDAGFGYGGEEADADDQTIEHFHRLKFLIETSTKLYGEFWGILAANISNNLNLHKLFTVGNSLNNYLREIGRLWEGKLKMKRVDIENQGVIQLYAHFLRKILRNRKKAEDVSKKLNEEHLFESKKNEEDNYEVDNLSNILEKQELIIYSRSNEKGECQIFQCSNSIVNCLGYTKQDFIGKPIEIMMPSLYIADHQAMLSKRIKEFKGSSASNSTGVGGNITSTNITPGTDAVKEVNPMENNKKTYFVLPKTKIGYLLAMNSKPSLYKDDDFSHTYIIKTRFDYVDNKFSYGYYILANEEFVIDSISSSALHLGLSLDLLKKHVMNLSILIRDEDKNKEVDLGMCYHLYEEEAKKITWVFPHLIYPKNDMEKQKEKENDKEEEDLSLLIEQSDKKHFMLQITKLKYSAEEPLGYCLRLSDCDLNLSPKRNQGLLGRSTRGEAFNDPTSSDCNAQRIRLDKQRHILFDLLRLSYVRTELLPNESDASLNDDYFQLEEGFNIKNEDSLANHGKSPKNLKNSHSPRSQRKKRSGEADKPFKGENNTDEDDEDDNQHHNDLQINPLTPEAIKSFHGKSSHEIRQFICSLPFFGNDVLLERHRSNKERYTTGKIAEPLIKISIEDNIKRVEVKVLQLKNSKKDHNKKSNENSSSIDSIITPSTNVSSSMLSMNSLSSSSSSSMGSSQEQHNYLQGKLATDSSQYLSNIFNAKSVKYINIVSLCIFLVLALMISVEFALSLLLLNESKARLGYVNSAYEILSAMMYTKFFLSEAIMAQNDAYPHKEGLSKKDYIQGVMNEMAGYRGVISDKYSSFGNASVTFSDEYYEFTANATAYIRTLINTNHTVEILSFSAMMSRIPTNIFYVSTVTDNYLLITMDNRNAYELMMNSLNDYMLLWLKVTDLIVLNTQSKCVLPLVFISIYIISFIVSVISLTILWFALISFINDRERPVNLFQTIKRQKFQEMKLSSEAFLNKLLNKFFGNEEVEDESLGDCSAVTHLKPDDIMIQKFSAKPKYNQLMKSTSEYLGNYINLVVFFIVFEGYMSFQYFYMRDSMENVLKYTEILNITHYSQSDMVLNLNVYKSYFFIKDIPIFNVSNTDEVYLTRFNNLTTSFELFIFESFNAHNFLQSSYLEGFFMLLNRDISSLIPDSVSPYKPALTNGFKPVAYQFIELIRLLNVDYLLTNDYVTTYDNAVVGTLNHIVRYVIRVWYAQVLKILNEAFDAFYDKITLIQISLFIILLVLIILLYCLLWKNYVDKLKGLLRTSVDLINLIPEEMKDNIVQRLNEEDNKKSDSFNS